ncbi:hypothetical protein [Stratiformator vulcanicus]|uniref:RHS Repeat protein n=1 Tax=Stratiformator vulcanicus TaxID=2527980 RepID=A0A517QWL1_9PLAN|nr:hypothetical protein [Stratiformator vulcanicus]QDT36056.1 hypothetical protein Pan189_04110 [Stratiformator vulcanicus]
MATKIVSYTYDASNRRIGKTVDSNADGTIDEEFRYLYDSDPAKGGLDDVVLVYDGSGSLITRNLHVSGADSAFVSFKPPS